MEKYISGLIRITTFTVLIGLMTSCYTDKSQRNVEYAANMYNSLPLEPFSITTYGDGINLGDRYPANTQDDKVTYFKDGLPLQSAPAGTVPRSESWYRGESYMPYPYPATPEGYEAAGTDYTSPLNNPDRNENGYNCTEATYNRGKEVYTTFCVMCHGANGDGQGNLVTKGVFGTVPSYFDPNTLLNLPEGKMFHTLTYGKGIMGSYASQISPQQRWEVICYIQEFQKKGIVPADNQADNQ